MLQQQKSSQRFCSTIDAEYKSEIAEILKRYDDNKARKQALVGTVVSTKCQKSITVRVVHKKLVPKYNKFVSVQRRIMAHDEQGLGKMGDLVRIVPCRPMSRKKRHALIDIVLRPKSVVTEDGTVLSSGGNVSKR